MPVAALYDIHGNLPALEAVLQEIREAGVDRVVVGGDLVPGPMCRETLRCLLDLDLPVQFIQGNGEAAVLAQMACTDASGVPQQAQAIVRWEAAQQLSPEYERLLTNWPQTLSLEIPGLGEVLFCHATPRSNTEVFTRLTPEDRLLPVFQGLNVPLVICGHTHMQFDRRIGTIRVVNAGSVGAPVGETGAYWILLGPDIQLRHTRYDLPEAVARIRATSCRHTKEAAAQNLLHPPSEAEVLERLTALAT
jgi:predicted phosphodiesterase